MRDVGLAEDLAQEALVAALEQWPESGVPDNPGAWLMATAKHRGIDRLRRAEVHQRKTEELARDAELRSAEPGDLAAAVDDPFDDDLLRLIFTACHPVLSTDARVALTLRLLCGLTTKEIARAYLVSEPTVAQRLVRAKRTLSAARVPFEVPGRGELRERLASVLEVVYLIFNEGYYATAGERVIRPELVEEALRLGRVLAELLPGEGEVHGLVSLMELQASRMRARISPSGDHVLLPDQDRSRWDWLLVGRGWSRSIALTRPAVPSARTRCRRRSRRAMRRAAPPRIPTGSRSSRFTTVSPSSCRHPWSSSTAPWRSGWRSARRRRSGWSTPCWRSRPSTGTPCCPACAATCWRSSAASARRALSTSAPRG